MTDKSSTKPSINWDHVARQFKWLAVDRDGMARVFTDEPSYSAGPNGCGVCAGHWHTNSIHNSEQERAVHFASLKAGTCGWKESKVSRPMKASVCSTCNGSGKVRTSRDEKIVNPGIYEQKCPDCAERNKQS